MKVGILGTGFGLYHAKIYKKFSEIDSIVIYGRDQEKLNKIKDELNIEVTDNIDDIINNKDIDLMDICLPSHLHKEYTIKALKSGKDVFCETPIALEIEDALAMQEAAKLYGKKVYINLFIKNEYPYEYLYDIYNKRTLGKLKALHIRRKTPPLWGDLGLNNIVTKLMIHEFDFITWLLGIPDRIYATGIGGKDNTSHVDTLLTYKDTVVEVHGSSMMPHHHPFTVGYETIFEEGTIEYYENGYEDKCEKSLIKFTYNSMEQINFVEEDCYEKSFKEVITCCTNNLPCKLSIDSAIKSLEVALKVQDKILYDNQ